MSKTESREFWVSDADMGFFKNTSTLKCTNYEMRDFVSNNKNGARDNKITISWQVPEKVVTISESEMREALYGLKGVDWVIDRIFKGEV